MCFMYCASCIVPSGSVHFDTVHENTRCWRGCLDCVTLVQGLRIWMGHDLYPNGGTPYQLSAWQITCARVPYPNWLWFRLKLYFVDNSRQPNTYCKLSISIMFAGANGNDWRWGSGWNTTILLSMYFTHIDMMKLCAFPHQIPMVRIRDEYT